MVHFFSQLARTGLKGPAFLDLLALFKTDTLSVLHSGHGREGEGFSVIGRNPLVTVRVNDEESPAVVEISPNIPWARQSYANLPADPLDAWESVLHDPPLDFPHHPLTSWIGYFSYDIARLLENIGNSARSDLNTPLLEWRLFEEYFLYDHARSEWTLVATADHEHPRAEKILDDMAAQLARSAPEIPPASPQSRIVEQLPRGEFLSAVQRIKDYIAAGDIFQANFAQRWKVQTDAHPIDIFRRLMHESPAAYAALIISPDDSRAIISASPELFLHRFGGDLFTRPIKGTRPRDLHDPVHDEQLRAELLHSEKDKAELAMIVDLLRNDLGRVAEYGSVHVIAPREIEKLPTLWHAAATIRASLFSPSISQSKYDPAADPRPLLADHTWAPLIRATMPGGSITGAPKIRAMQIIEELEKTRRGLYCGAIGCIGTQPEQRSETLTLFHPVGTLNIAIRTIQMHHNIATLHAGAGIVADSTPELEYDETLHKAAAILRALGISELNH